MNWTLFVSIYSLIFIAELPDKTAFATLMLATRGKPFAIFSGVALAFVIQSLIAILFGSLISLLPEKWVHLGAGLLYLAFAYHAWFHDNEAEQVEVNETENEVTSPKKLEKEFFYKNFTKAFIVIFIAEWGDITQIATATMAAKYTAEKWTVFVAATLALWSVTAIAIFVGHKLKHIIHVEILKKVSSLVFVLVGIYFIYTWF